MSASLSNVILLHVSTSCLARTDKQRKKQEEREYYAVLGLPKYSPPEEIRKAYRRMSLRIRCDRMMAASIVDERERQDEEANTDKWERRVKEAFRVLGDKHLRQQYHLLQCSQARYSVIRGAKKIHDKLLSSTYTFPYVAMQSVLVAAMVNAIVENKGVARWVMVLIPTWVCYGAVVLFWFCMLELPRKGQFHSFWTMMAYFVQHALVWLGLFAWAWYMDGDMPEYWTWHMVALPFYAAIAFRSFCTVQAVNTLKKLQSIMVSREFLDQQQFTEPDQEAASSSGSTPCSNMTPSEAQNADENDVPPTDVDNISNGEHRENDKMNEFLQRHIVVTVNPKRVRRQLRQLVQATPQKGHLTNDEVETVRIKLSAEFSQADQAARSLTKATAKLIVLGASFLLLLACKFQGQLDISFWFIFLPFWIYFVSRIFGCCKLKRRNSRDQRRTSERDDTTTRHGEDNVITTAPVDTVGTDDQIDEEAGIVTLRSIGTGTARGEPDTSEANLSFNLANPTERADWSFGEGAVGTAVAFASNQMTRDGTGWRPESPGSRRGEDETFERWQSVYEHIEIRGVRFYSVSLAVFFQLLIMVLIVVKLQLDFGKSDPSGFNAFLIILIPFTVGLVLCCCGVTIGCIELAREVRAPANVDSINNEGRMGEENQTAQEEDPDAPPPMQAGAHKSREIIFSKDIDTQMPDLTMQQRITVLASALPISDEEAEDWLVAYAQSQNVQTATMWELVIGCADSHNCERVNGAEVPEPDIDFLGLAWLALLRRNLEAHFERAIFQAKLDAIQPVADADTQLEALDSEKEEKSNGLETLADSTAGAIVQPATAIHTFSDEFVGQEVAEGGGPIMSDDQREIRTESKAGREDQTSPQRLHDGETSVECLVCCEDFHIAETVYCEGTPMHFFCKGCFHRYATESVQTGGISGMPCAEVTCDSTFATSVVRDNLSAWDLLRIEDRENECNTRVALAAKAALQCECGAVAIVTEEDMGDGCISCPGCDRKYCAVCGNYWHPDTNCPPTKKVLQWMVKNTMPCPNCHSPIEKNAGCDHMHCAPPGGCGHHFSYRTGKPMSKSGRNLPDLYS